MPKSTVVSQSNESYGKKGALYRKGPFGMEVG